MRSISCQWDAMHSLLVFVFCVFTSGAYSAVFLDKQPEIPGHEGQCYDTDGKTFYNKGDVMKNESEECIKKICRGTLLETGELSIQIFSCAIVEAGPGFTIIQDPSKPYPECCPTAVAIPGTQPDSCDWQKQE